MQAVPSVDGERADSWKARLRRWGGSLLTLVAVLLVAGGGGSPGAAADGAAPSRDEVAALVRELDANSRVARVAAEERLLQAGPSVLDWLPTAESRPPGHPLISIIDRLEREQTASALRPLRFPWGPGETVGDWLTRVETSGLMIDRGSAVVTTDAMWLQQPLPEGPAIVDLWDGLARLEQAWGGRFVMTPQPRGLRWVDPETGDKTTEGGAKVGRAIPAGPFLVRVASRGVRANNGGTGARPLARVAVSLQTQPRVRGLITYAAPDEIVLTLPDGRRLASHVPGTRVELFWEREDESPPVVFDVDWSQGQPGKVNVRGKVDVLVAAAMVRSEFSRIARSTPTTARPLVKKRAGRTIAVEKVEVRPDDGNQTATVAVRLLLTIPEATKWFESHQWGALPYTARLERTNEAGGVDTVPALRRGDWDVRFDGVVLLEQRFEKVPEPVADWTLVVELPGLIDKRRVEFAGEVEFSQP
jgi:hypothetical protein